MYSRFLKPLMGAMVVSALAATAALAADPVIYAGAKGQGVLAAKSEAPADFVEPFGPDFNKVDAERNVWGEQTVQPPRGLVLVKEGPHVGEQIYERSKNSFGKVNALLVDPATGLVHYYLVSSRFFKKAKRHLPIPVTATDMDGDKVLKTATPLKSLKLLDLYTKEELDAAYPSQKLSGVPTSTHLVFMMAAR